MGGGYTVTGMRGVSFGAVESCLITFDEYGNLLWDKIYSNISGYYASRYGTQTADSGYVFTGYADNGDEITLQKTDHEGNIQWMKNFSGPMNSGSGEWVEQTHDGGYIITGGLPDSGSYTGDVLMKTDALGNILWSKSFGEVGGWCVREMPDGGFAVAGNTYSGSFYKYLLRTDSSGNLLWHKVYPVPSNTGSAFSFCLTADGGFAIATKADGLGAGSTDVCVIKTDSSGHIEWIKAYGGPAQDYATSIQQTSDGGYIVSGTTFSFGTSLTYDLYILKIDSAGNIFWNKTYGDGTESEGGPYGLIRAEETQDSGFVISSSASYSGNDIQIILVKTNASGFSGCNEGNPPTITTTLSIQETDTLLAESNLAVGVSNPTITVDTMGHVETICESIGIDELRSQAALKIFPNPFHESAKLNSPFMMHNAQLRIYNTMGSLVREEEISNINSYILQRDDLGDGLYFYELLTPDSQLIGVGKFVIE